MKITKTGNVVIDFSGASGYYDGALVAGEFRGRRYYSAYRVAAALGLCIADLDNTDLGAGYNDNVTIREKIIHSVQSVRSTGYIIR